ncbi:MAG TPA: Minf_1886 family protein [Planctomycetota bacterium]|nr:Minf_1886 family protein [Planctomycetota bacterium]
MADERDDEQKISQIILRDDRYHREAYRFVQEGLEYTVQRRGRRGHVSGKELLEGLRDLARERFGLMARTVLNQWGVKSTSDFGEIVFNLVDEQVMSKQDSDTREDFANVYDFEEVFDQQTQIEIEE